MFVNSTPTILEEEEGFPEETSHVKGSSESSAEIEPEIDEKPPNFELYEGNRLFQRDRVQIKVSKSLMDQGSA